MKLTLREKILLTVFIFVLVVSLGVNYFVVPEINNLRKVQKLVSEKESEKINLDNAVIDYKNANEHLQSEKKRAEELDYFYKSINQTFIDELFQNAAEVSGVSIKKLEIENPQIYEVKESENSLEQDIANNLENQIELKYYNCNLEIRGEKEQIINFIDRVNNNNNSSVVHDFLISDDSDDETLPFGKVTVRFYFIEEMDG